MFGKSSLSDFTSHRTSERLWWWLERAAPFRLHTAGPAPGNCENTPKKKIHHPPYSNVKKAISLMLANLDRDKESLPKDIGQQFSICNMTNTGANTSKLI